ncbi:mitochondrial carrier domain-containing protein [Catenaria anguillulae PL171]|uniref:Mitochondrial carrier domain-containing protein n=1 Tax=Catenaria anguillulae PL171 TaxID=765915 RepID=A0A1Y2I3A6_9FUNG|nr:mitochondrial carrier domain-containing protein [Catenaria anguillulae PL171]
MAPHVHSSRDGKKVSGTARFVGAATSGALELICFHPVDTIAKRLMSNQSVKVFGPGMSFAQSTDAASKIIFRDAYSKPAGARYLSLFPGLGFAAGYKVLQRVYKFGGQPIVKDYIKSNHGETFKRVFGEKSARTWMEATAGSLVGIGEIVLLPLDVLKIKSQTNPESLKGRGIVDLFVKNGRDLYRGAGWTAARNAPGSFALFGGNQMAKTYLCGLKDDEKPTFLQLSLSSMVGSIASIVVAAPLDVVKTRIQNRPFDSPESGYTIIKNMVRNEGMGAFFKGLGPKVLVVGPKLIFSFTVAQYLIAKIHETLD